MTNRIVFKGDSLVAEDESHCTNIKVYFAENDEESKEAYILKAYCKWDGDVHLWSKGENPGDEDVYFHSGDLQPLIDRLQAIQDYHKKWAKERGFDVD